ncbi:NAD-dependent epimerase/dehydratase family protein [Acidithiobacillus sp. CV18-2]|nr:NAD-dependent epimerase/dehydratase family protein [Acidithiobacillus sp. CV18-3]MBU2756306.1 NAD-dependent epimerase/dehydratase family protein [Acidithiobacillus sp. BN09-2]MBU2775927.1 NAD-dependent epimerase/dehydratase family protein [Acidithiobacillus sp. CV18-2]MBU2799119.1 NAD-dependent epimerase/dehydratase family protein [Acidithiobacillus sp. VAN18-4]
MILVTGLSGFTGRHLAERLRARGARVVGLSNSGQGEGEIACDLTDAVAVRNVIAELRPTHVAHLVAISFVGHGNPRAFYDVNVFGTLNLLEALAALPKPPRKILITSSANIYGSPSVEVIDESVCPAPVNHYACSKLAMEHMVHTWFDRLPIVMTRPFNYTGVGQDEKFLIPKIVSHFRRRAPFIELGNLDVSRDFSDVRDVVAIYTALLLDAPDAVGQTFNICSGRAYSLRNILQMVEEIREHLMEVRINPSFVRANEMPRLLGSNALLRKHTGLVPQIPLRDTLRWMLQTNATSGVNN